MEFILNVKRALANDEHRFAEFKNQSTAYHRGLLSPQSFYSFFIEHFGEESEALFGTLVSLISDQRKRMDLMVVHNDRSRLARDFPALHTKAIRKKVSGAPTVVNEQERPSASVPRWSAIVSNVPSTAASGVSASAGTGDFPALPVKKKPSRPQELSYNDVVHGYANARLRKPYFVLREPGFGSEESSTSGLSSSAWQNPTDSVNVARQEPTPSLSSFPSVHSSREDSSNDRRRTKPGKQVLFKFG